MAPLLSPMLAALSVAAILVFATAAVTDIRERRIPNGLSVALAILGALRVVVAIAEGSGVLAGLLDLTVAIAVFAAGAVAFRFGLLGGGDVKLFAAGALWLGAAALGPYLVTTVLAGGALAVLFIAALLATPGGMSRESRPKLPYAVAIAAGGILTTAAPFWT